jgi:hypothetical protein
VYKVAIKKKQKKRVHKKWGLQSAIEFEHIAAMQNKNSYDSFNNKKGDGHGAIGHKKYGEMNERITLP